MTRIVSNIEIIFKKIGDVRTNSINVSDSDFKRIHFFADEDISHDKFSENIQKFSALTIGKKIKLLFDNNSIDIPDIITRASIQIDADFFKKSNMGKFLVKSCTDSECEIVSWDTKTISDNWKEYNAVLENVNIRSLIGAMSASVKENSASLGKDAVLFDSKSIEEVQSIVKYLNKYRQAAK